jgi:hypothetical protein
MLSFTPDYLSYINFPRRDIWMQITDSNLDWGQGLKQANRWVLSHPQPPGKRVYVLTRNGRPMYDGFWYLDHRVRFLERGQPPPEHGILIISPVWVCGVYDEPGENPYAFLQRMTPSDVIGHAMPVYDLDARDARDARDTRPTQP